MILLSKGILLFKEFLKALSNKLISNLIGAFMSAIIDKSDVNLICEYTKKSPPHICNFCVKIYFSLFTNCPQAAAISFPLLLLKFTIMLCFSK